MSDLPLRPSVYSVVDKRAVGAPYTHGENSTNYLHRFVVHHILRSL